MTDAQSRAHFLRHEKGRWQTGQVFSGSSDFFRWAMRRQIKQAQVQSRVILRWTSRS